MLRPFALLVIAAGVFAADAPKPKFRPPSAAEVFDPKGPVTFADDFSSGVFSKKWRFSENANYEVTVPNPDLIQIVDAPGLPGKKGGAVLSGACPGRLPLRDLFAA
jgi:hypothetical protein